MLYPPVIKHTAKQAAHRRHSALAVTQQRGGNRRSERRADVGQRQVIRQRAVFEKQRQQPKRRAQSVHQQKVLPRMRITGCRFFSRGLLHVIPVRSVNKLAGEQVRLAT